MTSTAEATVAGTLESISRVCNELDQWDCERMDIAVATSLTNHTPEYINFTETIGHRTCVPRADKRDDNNCYWLNHEWRVNTSGIRANVIIPYFVGCANEAGFRINGDWESKNNVIVFHCIRGRKNNTHKNKEAPTKQIVKQKLKKPDAAPVNRNKKSQRAPKLSQKESEDPEVEEESEEADRHTCKMTFRVPWDERRRRWFVPKLQARCIHHNSHPRIDHSLL